MKTSAPSGLLVKKGFGTNQTSPSGADQIKEALYRKLSVIPYMHHYLHGSDHMVDVNVGQLTFVSVFTHSTPSLFRLASIP